MNMNVKVFQTNPLESSGRIDKDLEDQINSWLSENSTIKIISVQTTALPPLQSEGKLSGSVVCMVFYSDGKSEEDKRAGFLR